MHTAAAQYYQISADQGRIFRKMIEGCAAAAALILGLQLVFNGFDPFEQVYLPMMMIGGPLFWGVVMSALGLARGLILIINGWWPHTHVMRKWLSALFVLLVWAPLASCFWWSLMMDVAEGAFNTYSGLAYTVFSLGAELVVFYAHASFVVVAKRGRDE